MKRWKKRACLLLTLALMLPTVLALGESTPDAGVHQPAAPETVLPAFDPAIDLGYLPEGMAPFILKDSEKGYWVYVTQDLRVEITRYQRTSPSKLVWYIADIRSENKAMHTISYNEEKPGRTNGMPEDMASAHKAVYAQSGDFYSYRLANDQRVGIIIRNGEILYDKTYSKTTLALPSLDTVAFFPNGNMQVFEPYELTAQEYLDLGAMDVLSFGPILIRGGEINPVMYTNFTHEEPRNAIGIISPGHYIGMLVEGRTGYSAGCGLQFMAETLYDLGCSDALNLDGGGKAAMLFMGESVELGNGDGVQESTRAIPDILAIGTHE